VIATVGGQRYKVYFRYQRHSPPVEHTRLNGKVALIQATTECHINPVDEEGKLVETKTGGHGYSWCSTEDNFKYSEAREHALRRAAADLGQDGGPVLHAWFSERRGRV
jgi:hypothetical protein